MKRTILMTIFALCTLAAGVGCNADADFNGVVSVDDIPVAPGQWKEMRMTNPDGSWFVEYIYHDLPRPELTANVIRDGAYMVYFKYYGIDDNGSETIPVQELLPCVAYEANREYTIAAEVSNGYLRIKVSPSDGLYIGFDKPMYFRLAIVR